ncbi:purine operon repressor, PurR [Thermaerobacter marianensis DSM 12885]|uniref:Purine operon repressor, PurR n=1 Tax=Thermaerobacter marianensis (strain ATCC 700841 / DSM 12885 / JCM 10246 / 7p75a) TaxID=644966 RepID=E6SL14_THEM7|nr:pur operon repressor [Thermaerobacter marianensis]ADU50216.1 purine operon repressor, PurR [Thermaerobacter marianensis DSM 12885]
MAKLKRSERIAALVKLLADRPGHLWSLSQFAERFATAKSTISDDLALIKAVLDQEGLGTIRTYPGVAGGVSYEPRMTEAAAWQLAEELAAQLRDPQRILPGGFLYMTDLLFTPFWVERLGALFATRFRAEEPDLVATVETKGIPLALMTARALGRPLVLLRRDSRVTEGPSVSITYVSGSSQRIANMSVPRRAVPQGARVLLVDDFMKGGGTARGMMDLMREVGARVVGLGVVIATAEPARKLVEDYFAVAVLEGVDTVRRQVRIRPSLGR